MRPISITRTAANRADHDDRADHDRLDLHRTAQTLHGRTPRSRCNRAAIAHHSSWNLLHDHRMAIVGASVPRSTPDRGPIMADRGENRGYSEAKLKLNSPPIRRGIEATIYAHGIAPSTPSNCLHDPSIAHDFGLIFPLKACISLLCCSTFDRFMKKLSEFRGRS